MASRVKFAGGTAEALAVSPSDDMTELDVGLAVLDALDPDYELTPEALDIRAWRFEQLVAHGYEIQDAMALAKSSDVDLQRARALVTDLGCPPALAAQILL
ncbi:MAG: hypothetical protein ABI896_10525 [Actinomycetota bacterium]